MKKLLFGLPLLLLISIVCFQKLHANDSIPTHSFYLYAMFGWRGVGDKDFNQAMNKKGLHGFDTYDVPVTATVGIENDFESLLLGVRGQLTGNTSHATRGGVEHIKLELFSTVLYGKFPLYKNGFLGAFIFLGAGFETGDMTMSIGSTANASPATDAGIRPNVAYFKYKSPIGTVGIMTDFNLLTGNIHPVTKTALTFGLGLEGGYNFLPGGKWSKSNELIPGISGPTMNGFFGGINFKYGILRY